MSHDAERLAAVRDAVSGLAGADLAGAGRTLLNVMGYRSPKTLDAPAAPAQFLVALGMDAARFETGRWRAVHFLFQLTGDELPALSRVKSAAPGPSRLCAPKKSKHFAIGRKKGRSALTSRREQTDPGMPHPRHLIHGPQP
jgi:hypothetical protein